MWRGNDRGGRCLYTFSVPSPVEASCPQTTGPEVEGLKARLGVLEAMVAQLVGGGERNPQRAAATSQPELQEALKRAVGERNLLQGEKRRLEQEVERVQRLMEEMRRETQRLKDRQCPPQTPPVPPAPSLQGSGLLRPAGGKDQHARQTTIFHIKQNLHLGLNDSFYDPPQPEHSSLPSVYVADKDVFCVVLQHTQCAHACACGCLLWS